MKNRYPGLKPFSDKESDLFFGRTEDIDKLYQKIKLSQLVVLHSKSGLGKSSLLNAGIVPKVNAGGLARPCVVRLGGYADNADAQQLWPIERLKLALKLPTDKKHSALDKIAPQDVSLWSHFKKMHCEGTFLLIFDQFEELFTYPTEQVADFGNQLSGVLRESMPAHIFERLEAHLANDNPLQADELEWITAPVELKIVFAIRSDRMSQLQAIAPHLPDVLHNLFELKPLGLKQAREAIEKPAALTDPDFETPPFAYLPETIKEVLAVLKDKNEHIEAFQLQIVCRHAERLVQRLKLANIRPADLGKVKEILENFYLELLGSLEYKDENEKRAVRSVLEDSLIFEKEKRRMLVYEGVLLSQISAAMLRQLANSYIIRSEPYSSGGFSFELSHDTLVEPILKAKSVRMQNERAAEEKRLLEQERQERAKERKRQWKIIFGVGLAAVISILFGVFGFVNWQRAKLAAERANRQTQIAVENEQKAQKALDKFEQEEARNDSLKLKNLDSRIATILNAGVKPTDLLKEKDSIEKKLKEFRQKKQRN